MHCARGFAVRDVVFGTVAAALLGAIAVPALSQVRMDSMRQGCIANYKYISQLTGSYANDNAGKMWALNWKAGMLNPLVPGNQYFVSDSQAQAFQAMDIIQRLGTLDTGTLPVPSGWVPGCLYSHLALLDYVDQPIPASFMICPADSTRQAFAEGDFSPYPATGENGTDNRRWPYSSSYSASAYMWSPSRQYTAVPPGSSLAQRAPMMYQMSDNFDNWSVDGQMSITGAIGPRSTTDVRFPSSKVFMSDDSATTARHAFTRISRRGKTSCSSMVRCAITAPTQPIRDGIRALPTRVAT